MYDTKTEQVSLWVCDSYECVFFLSVLFNDAVNCWD